MKRMFLFSALCFGSPFLASAAPAIVTTTYNCHVQVAGKSQPVKTLTLDIGALGGPGSTSTIEISDKVKLVAKAFVFGNSPAFSLDLFDELHENDSGAQTYVGLPLQITSRKLDVVAECFPKYYK